MDTLDTWLALPGAGLGRGSVELQCEDTEARRRGVREVMPDISVYEAGSSIVKEGVRGREGREGDSDRIAEPVMVSLEKPGGLLPARGVSLRGLQRTTGMGDGVVAVVGLVGMGTMPVGVAGTMPVGVPGAIGGVPKLSLCLGTSLGLLISVSRAAPCFLGLRLTDCL